MAFIDTIRSEYGFGPLTSIDHVSPPALTSYVHEIALYTGVIEL